MKPEREDRELTIGRCLKVYCYCRRITNFYSVKIATRVSRRLLLRDTVKRAEAPDEIGGVEAADLPGGKEFG